MMICVILAGSLILVELPTDWMPIRNGYQNTISEGFTPVLGHVMLYQPREGGQTSLCGVRLRRLYCPLETCGFGVFFSQEKRV